MGIKLTRFKKTNPIEINNMKRVRNNHEFRSISFYHE